MSYYSDFSYTFMGKEILKVNIKKAKALEEFFNNKNNLASGTYDETKVYGFYGVKLPADIDGILYHIELEDLNNKFYDDKLFAKKLSEVVTSGTIRLIFLGEDKTKWGFDVSSNSVVKVLFVGLNEKELDILEFIENILSDINKKKQFSELLNMDLDKEKEVYNTLNSVVNKKRYSNKIKIGRRLMKTFNNI